MRFWVQALKLQEMLQVNNSQKELYNSSVSIFFWCCPLCIRTLSALLELWLQKCRKIYNLIFTATRGKNIAVESCGLWISLQVSWLYFYNYFLWLWINQMPCWILVTKKPKQTNWAQTAEKHHLDAVGGVCVCVETANNVICVYLK